MHGSFIFPSCKTRKKSVPTSMGALLSPRSRCNARSKILRWDQFPGGFNTKRFCFSALRKVQPFWGAQHFGGNGVVWKNSDSATSNVMKISETQWPRSHACFRTHHNGLCKDLEWKDHQLLQGWVRVERSLLKSVDQWTALRLKLKDYRSWLIRRSWNSDSKWSSFLKS